jgi:hypothetical protein
MPVAPAVLPSIEVLPLRLTVVLALVVVVFSVFALVGECAARG